MLDVWLIPALIVLAVVILSFFLVIRTHGGTGVRTDGRTIVHKPMQEDDLPPA